ncbi:MAG: acyltransferase, partial [Rhizorhabdus sp.]
MEVRHTLGERYFALDAMRGIAALLVVLYHCAEILPALKIQGHLAVDFFFALSGFVIARAYQDRLAAGLPFQRFALARVIRLYPLFLAGTLIGASRHVMGAVLNLPEAIPMGTLLPILLLNAFMLPGPSPNEYIFPFDGPTWSLFFELIVNLAFGLFLFRWSAGRLWVLVAVSGVVLGALTIQAGHSNLGWSWPTIPGGFARVFFSFTLGMLFSRILANTPKRVSWWGLVPMLLLIALMLVDVDPRNQAAFDLFSVLIGAPLLLLGGIALDVPAKLRRACGWL